jgi:hypothetical protein
MQLLLAHSEIYSGKGPSQNPWCQKNCETKKPSTTMVTHRCLCMFYNQYSIIIDTFAC